MRKRHSVRRNRFTHILTWALVTVLAVQSFLPSCAYALETGRIQRLAEAIATYRSGSAVAIDAGVTVRTSDKMSGEGVASGELSTSAETPEEGSATSEAPEEGSATSEPAAEGEPATSTAPNDGAGADGDAGGLDDPAQDESTAAEDAAAIDGAEVLSDGEDDGTGKVLLADEAAVGQLDGRDYVGQTVKDINGTKYILIGNEQQLRAIGTGKHVVDKVWHRPTAVSDWKLEYVGDADITPDQTLADTTYALHETLLNYGYYGSNESGEVDVENDASPNTGLTYSADANYIIFRDIDLSQKVAGEPEDNLWTPLTFSGTMTGAKAGDGGKIWDDAATAIQATGKPTIAHVTVNHADTKLDTSAYTGIGFFSTLTNRTDNVGMNTGQASVSNLIFDGTSVTSNASEVKRDPSLINTLTGILSGLLGGLLDIILGILGFHLDLADLLTSLLTVQNNDPSTFATGAFAGRIVGDVSVHGIEMRNPTVSNTASGMTGGFVGYTDGATQYDGLSGALGQLTGLLENLLNIIPGLGLGDLITILLDNNILDLDKLIPTGYVSPTISDVTVTNPNADGAPIGNEKGDYAGGFAGQLTATVVSGATVTSDGNLNIQAKNYAGGFVGLARNGEIQGTLDASKLVQLEGWDNTPQTLVHGSGVSADGALNVAAVERYAGGFVGGLAAAHMVDDGVNAPIDGASAPSAGTVTVTATLGHAGGFAGIATLGWETDLGKDDASGSSSLLANVNGLLSGILTGETQGNAEPLLALVGIKESTIFGAQVSGGSVTVSTDGDHAAGLLGEGRGTVIASVSDAKENGETYWEAEVPEQLRNRLKSLGVTPKPRGNAVTGLASVTAGGGYAGGIAGSMQVASGGGLLNSTLGLVNVMSPVADSVTVEGAGDSGTTVTAEGDYAAGGVAAAVGMISNGVTINGLASVTADDYAGGFMGTSSAGDLVSAGDGINLLGLNLVSVKGLLSVGSAVQTKVSDIYVNGVAAGMSVKAGAEDGRAGGFVALGSASSVSDAHVTNLGTVQASTKGGYAGGFVGESTTAGLADVGDETEIKSLIEANGLLGAVTYLLPSYTGVDVTFSGDERSVTADYAGGFAGEFEAGTVDNTAKSEDKSSWYAVYGISEVTGRSYAGGFGGRVVSGALAEAGKGISILGGLGNGLEFNLADLVNVVSAYIPTIKGAGVSSSEDGLAVIATGDPSELNDAEAGAAGGFIGYASGAQVSDSHVNKLRHTTVTDPADLEMAEAGDYFNASSDYAVKATRFAGGYCGYMDIGNAASVGGSLGILGETIDVQNLLGLMPVVATTIEHSNVYGAAGGYAVLADGGEGSVGYAGGFAGKVSGGHVQDSNSYNFSHIIGRVAAGGYAGEIEPGDVARVLDEADTGGLLSGVIETQNLLSLVQAFVPSIRNSETTSVPCGGVVRAQAESDASTVRGMAGGYVGHNEGGQIWGNNNAPWKNESEDGKNTSPYNGPQREAAAIRIRSVYGAEYAGGFTGLMESASTASTGSLSLLWGLVKAENLLGALNAIYPTEENTAVYGPLAKLDVGTWNAWVDAVGVNGGYGAELAATGNVETQEELYAKLADVVYGMNVVAGREDVAEADAANAMPGGAAGGYVGAMVTGTITNGHAHDVRQVRGMRAAGGFAGMAEAGGAAQLGSVDILGLNLDLGNLLSVANVFVPVIKSSTTTGYRTGMTVESSGTGARQDDITNSTGNAGGYIGLGSGVQIWGDGTDGASDPCTVSGLRRVRGAAYAGGFAGRLTAGTVASVDTDSASSGFLQQVIDAVLQGTGTQDLAQVLNATMSTVRGASVTPADEAWGFTVEGPASGDVRHPIAAGGFAGAIEATVLGTRDQGTGSASALTVTGLRGIDGGLYAGGFVGVATAGGVAQVNAGTGEGASTTILGGLLKLGNIDAIQAFQPFIYGGSVTGVADGLQVRANSWDTGGLMHSQRMSGNAGGFAGTVMSGEVLNSKVANLNSVTGINYTGGFVGYTGKSGIADVEDLDALKLIGLTASVGDLIGTTVTDCSVAGIPAGYTVASQGPAGADSVNGDKPDAAEGGQKAGGFIGYADLARITRGTATNLKRVGSTEAAGGFAGETSHAYLVSAAADSAVLGALNQVVNALVKALYLDKAEQAGVIEVELGEALQLHILDEGDVLSVTLLGLKISASLSKGAGEGGTDVVNVTIGDSEIKLPCNEKGLTEDADLEVNLIKGNSARITNSTVTGIADGYDVFGGGATQDANGMDDAGYAGGFVGHNDEGVLTGDEMVYADVVRGTKGKTGPFTGVTDYSSNWWFNSVDDAEHDNTYHVYRGVELEGATVSGAQNMKVSKGAYDTGAPGSADAATADNAAWTRFAVTEHQPKAGGSNLGDWQGAAAGGADLGVYMEDGAKAVLMDDTAVTDNTGGLTPEPGDGQDPCAQKVDVTVRKVWNDGHDADGKRPDSITVQLTATYTDESGKTHTPETIQTVDTDGNPLGDPIENPITVTLSTADQSAWTDTWRKVVEDLPVAIKVGDAVHYLTYTPTEVTVGEGGNAVKLGESGYTVSYTVDAHDRVITITNSTPLPETGGPGIAWFALAGAAVAAAGLWLGNRRRRPPRPAGSHFSG